MADRAPNDGGREHLPFASYHGSEPYAFVSYSHADAGAVYDEMARLDHLGFRLWYDEGIPCSGTWTDELAIAIQGCDAFVVFLTPRALASHNVLDEIHYALKVKRRLVPVYLEPTELSPGLDLQISRFQALHRYQLSREHFERKLHEALDVVHAPSIGPKTAGRVASEPALGAPDLGDLEFLDLVCAGDEMASLVAVRDLSVPSRRDPDGLPFHLCQVGAATVRGTKVTAWDPLDRLYLPPSRHASLAVQGDTWRVFAAHKAKDRSYHMTGFVYESRGGLNGPWERRTLFEDRNWGWFSRFEPSGLLHYCYKAHRWVRDTIEVGPNVTPGEARQLRADWVAGHSGGRLRLRRHGAPLDEQRQADDEVRRALTRA